MRELNVLAPGLTLGLVLVKSAGRIPKAMIGFAASVVFPTSIGGTTVRNVKSLDTRVVVSCRVLRTGNAINAVTSITRGGKSVIVVKTLRKADCLTGYPIFTIFHSNLSN